MELNPNQGLNTSALNLALDKMSGFQGLSQKKEVEAAQEFESVFIQLALKDMRPKPDEDSMFNAGQSEEMFYQFLDEAIAKDIAKSPNNFGIADSLMRELF
jgi:Rod binding domain-containing protein